MYLCDVTECSVTILKDNNYERKNKLKVVNTTWGDFLKEHPVQVVVEMPDWPKDHVARVVTVNAVLA